jgi:paraquat-inducible protein A
MTSGTPVFDAPVSEALAHTTLVTARNAGLVACHRCGQVHAAGTQTCRRCAGPISSRDPHSLQRVWAWLIAGIIVYIPANTYPMLLTSTLGDQQESTIMGGFVDLMHHGSYAVALIVFFASVVIPMSKFAAIGYLAYSVRSRSALDPHQRHRLYEVVEFIGRWSMIDVFVVAILSALVQLGSVATINPGIAAVSFALSVAFTMLSAQSIDPRLIWDASSPPAPPLSHDTAASSVSASLKDPSP